MKTTLYLFLCALVCISCTKTEGALSDSPKKAIETKKSDTTPNKLKTASTISFAGYTWNVTNAATTTQGPGPNYFSASNVWVDGSGFLHLKLAKNPSNGHWECAQLTSTTSFGYGTFQWKVDGAIDSFDKNIVFGMFNYSGNDGFDEMDIEYSQWGHADNPHRLNYTLFPATGDPAGSVEVVYPFTLTGTYTTQRFKRTSNSVTFKSLGGFHDDDTNLYASKTWNSPPNSISTLSMPIMMNLWCFHGVTPPTGTVVEVVIHDFKYTPL